MKKTYQNIIVVGRSNLAEKCLKMAMQMYPACAVRYYKASEQGTVKSALTRIGDAEVRSVSRQEIMEELAAERTDSLVLSICNPYLFPERVLGNPALMLVNVHHALLPRHRGRNAEGWAVFMGDTVAGITWHEIAAEVDAGRIICQREMKMTVGRDAIPAVKVYQKLNELVLESFPEVLTACMEGTVRMTPMPASDEPIHYAKDVPGNGYLDPCWPADTICQFLCAMDYGVLYAMGRPKLRLGERTFTWKRYEWTPADHAEGVELLEAEKEIRLYREGMEFRLHRIAELEETT